MRAVLDVRDLQGGVVSAFPCTCTIRRAGIFPLHQRGCPSGLLYALEAEIENQDLKHGPIQGATPLGASRLALACIEDEVVEALTAWDEEKAHGEWDKTRVEVLQVAAIAFRALRDALS